MPGILLDTEDVGVKKQMKFLLVKLVFHWGRGEGQIKNKRVNYIVR